MKVWEFIKNLPGDILYEIQWFLSRRTDLPRWAIYPIRSYKDWLVVRQFPVGTVVEDCSYHPGIIIKVDSQGDITVKSLINGREGNCSLFHCGIVKLNEHEVEVRKEAYAKGGTKGLLRLVGWSDADFENYKDYSF